MLTGTTLKSCFIALTPGFLRPHWATFEGSPLGKRIARVSFWSLLGATINRGLYLVLSILAARMLGKEGLGQFSLIQTTVGMFALFAGFGLGLACSKHVAELRMQNPVRAGRIMVLSAVLTGLTGASGCGFMLLFAPWLARHTTPDPSLVGLFRISSPMVFFGAINGAQSGILAGFEAFKTVAVLNVISGVVMLAFVVAGIQIGGIQGALWAVTLSMALTTLISSLAIQREAKRWRILIHLLGWTQELGVVWRFCLPVVLASLLVSPVYWLAQAVLTKHFGFGAQAEYSIGAQWRTAVSWLPAILTSAFLPVLSSLPADKEILRHRLIISGLGVSGVVALVGALLIAIFAELLLRAYGPSFQSGAWVLRILAAAAVFDSLNDLINQSFLASGCAWFRLWANCMWAVLTVFGILLVVPRAGALGLATVLLCTQGLHLLFQSFLYRHARTSTRGTRDVGD